MLYYLACMAHKMTFEQLFRHMERYISHPEDRWKQITRVKRGIQNPNEIGCYSRDQCYFEGAIEILEKLNEIDFQTLMCGKLCLDEIQRVKRLTRTDCIKIPKFAINQQAYKDKLRQIAIINGILPGDSSQHMVHTLYNQNDIKRKGTQSDVFKYIDFCVEEVKQMRLQQQQQRRDRGDTLTQIENTNYLDNNNSNKKTKESSVCIVI